MAGYSGTPLFTKLGIREGYRVRLVDPPDDYEALVSPLPDGVVLSNAIRTNVDLCHVFAARRRTLEYILPRLEGMIRRDGCIWVSWPKKSSGVASEVTEDVVRSVALPLGLVDIKVCAVDDIWSGLKLVIRKKNR